MILHTFQCVMRAYGRTGGGSCSLRDLQRELHPGGRCGRCNTEDSVRGHGFSNASIKVVLLLSFIEGFQKTLSIEVRSYRLD
jgi:hypothetical protein